MFGRRTVLLGSLVFGSYVLLTILFWGVYVGERGLPGETGFIELSQLRPGLKGFIYPYDASRQFMSFSFHLAYLLSNGSYLSLHILFGTWILLTGILAYLIIRRLNATPAIIAFLVGALAITFGADQGANWAAYVVQRQTVVFALLAVWLLLVGWDRRAPWLLLLAATFQYLSLWTYEGCLPALLAVPILLYRPRVAKTRLFSYSAAWSVIPIAKLSSLVYDNWILRQQSYEARVLANRPSALHLGHMLTFYLTKGLAFWEWPAMGYQGPALNCGPDTLRKIEAPVIAGVLVVLAASLLIRLLEGPNALPPGMKSLRMALVALPFLALAYTVFIFLQAPSLLRTQMVSAVPAAVVITGVFAWLDSVMRTRGVFLVLAAALVAGCGLASGLLQQLDLSQQWAVYRKIMRAIVEAVPCVKDDTLIVLVQVPTRMSYSLCANDPPSDPFRDVMWFNSGLQVLYPNTRLVGLYYRSDGSSSDSIRFKFGAAGAALDHAGIGLEGDRFDYAHMVALRYDENRGAVLLGDFPSASVPGASDAGNYQPRQRIACSTPPADVRHRLYW